MMPNQRLVQDLNKIIPVPYGFSFIDVMHIFIEKSNLTEYTDKDIVRLLNNNGFPWAMVYDETPEKFWITLC